MNNVKNLLLFSIAGIFIIFRIVLDQTPFEIVFVAAVTVISLIYVLFNIATEVYRIRSSLFDNPSFPKIVARKQKKKMQRIILALFVGFLALSITYILKLKSSALNDALAILTLVISIEDSFIVNVLTKQSGKDA